MLQQFVEADATKSIRTRELATDSPEGLDDLLTDERRDVLHGDEQLIKASLKMQDAHFDSFASC